MKFASCFFISIALHAAIFAVPVSHYETMAEPIIPVTLLRGEGGSGLWSPEQKGLSLGTQPQARLRTSRFETRNNGHGTNHVAEALPRVLTTNLVTQDSDGQKFFESVSVEASSEEPSGLFLHGTGERSEERVNGAGNSDGWIGLGGNGTGEGRGSSWTFAQADYAHNPKPKYPERAQREGWEGAVLLRVLVNRQGRPESIEVTHSSGFETLDRAAMDTVKDWRFHPARYGEREVESWVKIPIIFRLADTKN